MDHPDVEAPREPSPSPLAHRLVRVRPGAPSLAWVRSTVGELQAASRLARVTIVAPSPYVAWGVRRALAERGCANVRTVVQLREIAERLARAERGSRGVTPLTGVLEGAAIRAAARGSGGPVLGSMAGQRSLQDALGALFRELRHLPDPTMTLEEIAGGGSVGVAAIATFHAYQALIRDCQDVPGLTRLAARAVSPEKGNRPAWMDEIGAIVLYLPPRLDAADVALLARLGRHLPIRAGFGRLGDVEADRPSEEMAAALSEGLGGVPVLDAPVPGNPGADLYAMSCPDPEEEARSVVRRVAGDLEAGVPLWRVAVLYTQEEPYGPLAREAMDAAGLPWHSAVGRAASAGWAARSLLGLLGLRDQRFAREAVLDWVASRPPSTSKGADDPLPDVPISAWDRLSRRAQVLEGPRQWAQRLETLVNTLEREEARRAAGEEAETAPRASAMARGIAAAVARLDRDTRPPAEAAGWGAFVSWAEGLRRRYVPSDESWPDPEREASRVLDEVLDSLRAAAMFEQVTTLPVFRHALAAALDARRLPEGRPGEGVLVSPVGSSPGLAFDRVYVLGMAEGMLPSRPPADPLASGADGEGDPLGWRRRQREGERLALLGSLAAADGGRATLSYARSDGTARALHPSRWLLDILAHREGRPALYASELPRLFGPERPWLERIASAYDGLARCATPANLADLRLREIVAWHALGRDPAELPLARRRDLPLGRALRAQRARRSRRFTEYDGNLAGIAARARRVTRPFTGGRGASSASALERWVGCPFQYLLQNVLGVEATERPEDEWTITPIESGKLVHAIFEQFFRELIEERRCTPDDRFSEADHVRLEQIAEAHFAGVEAEGHTGHPLAWENSRAAILADLHAQLERDEAWRREDRLMPALLERTFGDPRDAESWPAVEIPLDGALVARFRGAIDRVDLSPDGASPRRALVIDYKTGGSGSFRELGQDNPVLGGRHVQLALYARALRGGLPGGLPGGRELDQVSAEYRFVSSKGQFDRRRITVDAAVDQQLDDAVRQIATHIRAGTFLPFPGAAEMGGFANCRFCDFDRVCSTTRDEAWERKHEDAGLAPLDARA